MHNEPHHQDCASAEVRRTARLAAVFRGDCTTDLTHVDKCNPHTANLTNVRVQSHLCGSKTSLSCTYDLTLSTTNLTFPDLVA
jgi:hypothetical protein